jgi:hypothetical protein
MTNVTNEFELLSEKEVENIYKINARTLQRERTVGTGIPYVKLGKRVRYKKGDVEKYIIKNTIGNYQYD